MGRYGPWGLGGLWCSDFGKRCSRFVGFGGSVTLCGCRSPVCWTFGSCVITCPHGLSILPNSLKAPRRSRSPSLTVSAITMKASRVGQHILVGHESAITHPFAPPWSLIDAQFDGYD